ncbi:MAG TPA: hypothetical protein VFU09_06070 [Candidatus Udaeobacter sp.]|nr:hypothetical protein [Candidatus Udaeobacter sp.]
MKEINVERFLEARTVAVLIGLAIGLGMFEHARLSDPKLLRDCNLPESAPDP